MFLEQRQYALYIRKDNVLVKVGVWKKLVFVYESMKLLKRICYFHTVIYKTSDETSTEV